MQHDLDRFLMGLAKKPLQNVNHKLHRSVVVVEDQDAIEGWLFGFRPGSRHNPGASAGSPIPRIAI
jgi:hypothetical protein